MKVPFQKSVTQYYPHMKPADVEIWERFIDENPSFYESVEYDVPVGTAPDFVGERTPEATEGARRLYSLKIDVVGFTGDSIDVIEVKPRAGPSALGQVVSYAQLYKRDYAPSQSVRAVVLTDYPFLDLPELARSQGVGVLIA